MADGNATLATWTETPAPVATLRRHELIAARVQYVADMDSLSSANANRIFLNVMQAPTTAPNYRPWAALGAAGIVLTIVGAIGASFIPRWELTAVAAVGLALWLFVAQFSPDIDDD